MWASPDPILARYMGGSPNGGVFNPAHLGLYTYTLNNPIRFRDPTGLAEQIYTTPEERREHQERTREATRKYGETGGQKAVRYFVGICMGLVALGGLGATVLGLLGTEGVATAAAVGGPVAAKVATDPRAQQVVSQAPALAAEVPAVAQALPQLAAGPGKQMLGEAVNFLKNLAPEQRSDAFRNFAQQIMKADPNWLSFEAQVGGNTVFVGEGAGAKALVFDRAGRIFYGLAADVYRIVGKGLEVAFDRLKEIK